MESSVESFLEILRGGAYQNNLVFLRSFEALQNSPTSGALSIGAEGLNFQLVRFFDS